MSGFYFTVSSIFFYARRTGLLASCTSGAVVLGAIVTWLLVGSLGLQGAAMGFAVMQGLLALFAGVAAIVTFDLPWTETRKSISTLLERSRPPTRLNPLNS